MSVGDNREIIKLINVVLFKAMTVTVVQVQKYTRTHTYTHTHRHTHQTLLVEL